VNGEKSFSWVILEDWGEGKKLRTKAREDQNGRSGLVVLLTARIWPHPPGQFRGQEVEIDSLTETKERGEKRYLLDQSPAELAWRLQSRNKTDN